MAVSRRRVTVKARGIRFAFPESTSLLAAPAASGATAFRRALGRLEQSSLETHSFYSGLIYFLRCRAEVVLGAQVICVRQVGAGSSSDTR